MRQTDQEKMWEVFIESSNGGPVTTGGPLKAGGGSSAPKGDEDAEDVDGDPYEDEEGEDKLESILKKCHSGDISVEEAHEHITKMMKGEPKEEDAENVKRGSAQRNTDKMRAQFTKGGSAANVKRPSRDRSVQGVKRDTRHTQEDI